jgi:(1->4)-alpha-D-glucan 1-alpha-D-glucosylmutase
VGAWPIGADRLSEHLVKATREAKLHTSWVAPDDDYEERLCAYVDRALADEALLGSVAQVVERLSPGFVTNVLGQRALTLLLPGIPDIYQGGEIVDLALTDPDNRRPPDELAVSAAVERVRKGVPDPAELDAAKLHLTSVGLDLRQRFPALLDASVAYADVRSSGPAAEHVLAFRRADIVVSVTRWALRRAASGGFRDTTIEVPAGRWTDAVTGKVLHSDGAVSAEDLHGSWPVALLVRDRG